MPTISLSIPRSPDRYDVTVGFGLLPGLGRTVRGISPSPRCCVVTDRNVAAHYLKPVEASLAAAGFAVSAHILEPGEAHKTLGAVRAALDQFLAAGVERSTPVIALGGGVVGDMAGLIAALLLRGVPFIQVPTTLLAAVDASVGGKVGVDHAVGKNLIGAFHQPTAVIADVDCLRTLPARELRCGLAECVKHAIIRDHALFGFIAANAAKLMACDRECLSELIAWNVRIKAAIVQEDPHEQGVRALLNLGHTFGHAIETVTHYGSTPHGEAVALGLIAAARLAQRRGKLPAGEVTRIIDLIDFLELPTCIRGLPIDAALHAMAADKKVRAGRLRFIIPTAIGSAAIINDASNEEIRAVLATLCDPPGACADA